MGGFFDDVWSREGQKRLSLVFRGVPKGAYRINFSVTDDQFGTKHEIWNSASCPQVVVGDDPRPVVVFVD